MYIYKQYYFQEASFRSYDRNPDVRYKPVNFIEKIVILGYGSQPNFIKKHVRPNIFLI